MHSKKLLAGMVCLLLVVNAAAIAADNELTDQEKQEGWILLFNGKDHTGWKCNNDKPIATPIEDNSLLPYQSGGYVVVYDKPFGDFILKCDVKMTPPACNSGIFFRVSDLKDPVHRGFELAIDRAGDGYHDFGAVYDLVKPTKAKLNGEDKWDSVMLKCQGPQITVSVNGEVVTKMNCDDFPETGLRPDGTKHKFRAAIKELPRVGYLGFQDHGKKVWYKNVKLLELKSPLSSEK